MAAVMARRRAPSPTPAYMAKGPPHGAPEVPVGHRRRHDERRGRGPLVLPTSRPEARDLPANPCRPCTVRASADASAWSAPGAGRLCGGRGRFRHYMRSAAVFTSGSRWAAHSRRMAHPPIVLGSDSGRSPCKRLDQRPGRVVGNLPTPRSRRSAHDHRLMPAAGSGRRCFQACPPADSRASVWLGRSMIPPAVRGLFATRASSMSSEHLVELVPRQRPNERRR
jgi:hypothetical protein